MLGHFFSVHCFPEWAVITNFIVLQFLTPIYESFPQKKTRICAIEVCTDAILKSDLEIPLFVFVTFSS